MGLRALAFIFLITRGQLGATSYHQECVDDMDEKDKKRLALRHLEDDSIGHLVEYVEGKESTDFCGQG